MSLGSYASRIKYRAKVLLAMILPLVIAIIVFGYYVTNNHIESHLELAEQRGNLLVEHYSSIVELSVIAGDTNSMGLYANLMFKEKDIVSVIIRDINNDVIFERMKNDDVYDIDQNKYSSDIEISGVIVGGLESEVDDYYEVMTGKKIGSIEIGILSNNVREQIMIFILIGVLSTIIGIVMIIFVGLLLANSITKPVIRLCGIVDGITRGEFNQRIKDYSLNEIGDLEKGIDRMAESLKMANDIMLSKVQKATNDLNSTVKELELRNNELENARINAEKLGKEKIQFLAKMSHELRTPLNAVIGFSSIIVKSRNNNERFEHANIINRSAKHLKTIIDDILLLTKIESGSFALKLDKFNIREACEDAVIMLSGSAYDKGLEIILITGESVPCFVDGDKVRLIQIITNLIDNAIKYTESGCVVIQIDYDIEKKPNDITISVKDTGRGIRSEDIDKLFDDFSQGGISATRDHGGVGLGLAISKRLALLMNGDITVSSEIGAGSSFCLMFPLLNPVFGSVSYVDGCLKDLTVVLYDTQPESLLSLTRQLKEFHLDVIATDDYGTMLECISNIKNKKPVDKLILSFACSQINNRMYIEIVNEVISLFSGPVILLFSSVLYDTNPLRSNKNQVACYTKPIRQSDLFDCIMYGVHGSETTNQGYSESENNIKPDIGGFNILLVDDNLFNQALLKNILIDRGVGHISVANSGVEAVRLVREDKYDLLIMDLHMPNQDGIETARQIRNINGYLRSVPIILLTADVMFDYKPFLGKGVIDYIIYKPIDECEFDDVFNSCIQQVNEKSGIAGMYNDGVIRNYETKSNILTVNDHALRHEIGRLCAEFRCAFSKNELKSCRQIMHQLIGVTGYHMLNDVSDLAITIQKSFNNNDYTNVELCIEEILNIISD